MNNLLVSLAARSLGSAPDLLRPKLPSLFEPPEDNKPVFGASVGATAQEEEPGAPIEVRSAERAHPRPRRHVANRPDREVPPRMELQHETSDVNGARRRTILPDEPKNLIHEAVNSRQTPREMVESTVPVVESQEEQKQAESPHPEAAKQSMRERDEVGTNPKVEMSPVPLIPKMEPGLQVQTFNAGDDSAADVSPTEEYAPDIHIRIGRIEVRAATPAPPQPVPRRTVTAQPQLTLEEYLRQRNEGRP